MSKIELKKTWTIDIALGCYFFVASFAVSDFKRNLMPQPGLSLIFIGLVFIIFVVYFLKGNKIKLNEFEHNTLLLFFFPILISLMLTPLGLQTIKEPEYVHYLKRNLPNRLLLIIANMTIIIGLLSITKEWSFNQVKELIKKYYFGLLLFSSVGVWQFLSFLLGIPYLNIQTRDHIHSVSQKKSFLINGRLTSFANEPSYLAPLMIDLMLLSFFISKKPIRPFLLGLFVLVFSYSGGGYLNLAILLLFAIIGYLMYRGYIFKRTNVVLTAAFLVVGFLCIIIKSDSIYNLVYPVIGRLDTLFDINKHSRMFMIFMPFKWVLEGSFINALFGYGPKSYVFLSLTKFLPGGASVHITSNNLFADTVFELGYVGFISYSLIFARFILVSLKRIKKNKEYLLAMLLSVHLAASSIYRADFMQSRFWIILFIILKLIEEGKNLRNKRY